MVVFCIFLGRFDQAVNESAGPLETSHFFRPVTKGFLPSSVGSGIATASTWKATLCHGQI